MTRQPARWRDLRRQAQRSPALRARHRAHRVGLWHYLTRGSLATLATAPVIYSLIVPFALLDLWVAVYQACCFRAWGVRPVPRRPYFSADRRKLAYLNAVEKLNCLYCTYANGVLAYVREVAARTEQYWCPIRHARRVRGTHHRYKGFVPYGDAAAYRERLPALRDAVRRDKLPAG